jgi:hypothetical protein
MPKLAQASPLPVQVWPESVQLRGLLVVIEPELVQLELVLMQQGQVQRPKPLVELEPLPPD